MDIISGSNDRDKERLVKIIIALIITIVLIVGGFLLYLNQYDFTALAMEGYGSSERRGRDSMGRYTSRSEGEMSEWGYYPRRYAWDDGERGSYRSMDEGRSMHGDKEKLRRMMEETDDERVRNALRTAMQQI